MYAVITTGGKQYKVAPGDVLFVEKLAAEAEDTVTFDTVSLLSDGKTVKVGKPFVKGAVVTATVVKNGRAPKIAVFTYKSKKNEKRKMGHRQAYTQIKIESVE